MKKNRSELLCWLLAALPLALAQVCPAATTDEVSLIAVPAHMPKPISLKPSIAPKVGKRKAAITLKRKITEIDWAMSSSDALITGAAAAIAEPPQIEEPTPTKVAIS